MKKTSWLLSVLFIIYFFTISVFPSASNAQIVAPPGVEEQISVKVTPDKPEPGENVSIFIESFSFDMNKAYVAWSINGVIKQQGPGKNSFSFTAGNAGTIQKIAIDISTEDKRGIRKTLTFAPAKVGLIVEADTYTPPFYKGKALFTPQSTLKVVAFPDLVTESGYRIPANELTYTWKVDGKVIQSASGYGKSSFIMEGNLIPRPIIVTAEVSAFNSPITAKKSIQVNVEAPEIVLYEDSLLYGVRREEAFTTGFYLSGKEVKLLAEPYFISAHIPESADLQYSWTLNGQTAPALARPNTIGLENRSGEAGTATLALTIEHLKKLLQAPSISLQLEFQGTE